MEKITKKKQHGNFDQDISILETGQMWSNVTPDWMKHIIGHNNLITLARVEYSEFLERHILPEI